MLMRIVGRLTFLGGWVFLATAASPLVAQDSAATNSASTNSAAPLDPTQDPAYFVKFGRDAGAKGDTAGAIAAFDHAIRLNPNYAPAYFNRGIGEVLKGQLDDARADFDHALQLAPDDADAYAQRGDLRVQTGDLDGAVADYDNANKYQPNLPGTLYAAGHVLYFQGKLDLANAHLNQAISEQPDGLFMYFIRGLVRYDQGNSADALADFQKSADLGYPYGALWAWAMRTTTHQQGLAHDGLEKALQNSILFPSDHWPTPIASYLLNKISEEDLIAAAKEGLPNAQPEQLCQAWFFIGVSKRASGDATGANDAFAMAAKTGAKQSEEFLEANRSLTQLASP